MQGIMHCREPDNDLSMSRQEPLRRKGLHKGDSSRPLLAASCMIRWQSSLNAFRDCLPEPSDLAYWGPFIRNAFTDCSVALEGLKVGLPSRTRASLSRMNTLSTRFVGPRKKSPEVALGSFKASVRMTMGDSLTPGVIVLAEDCQRHADGQVIARVARDQDVWRGAELLHK